MTARRILRKGAGSKSDTLSDRLTVEFERTRFCFPMIKICPYTLLQCYGSGASYGVVPNLAGL